MFIGADISSWETITDAGRFVNGGSQPLGFVYLRGGCGRFNDEKYKKHFELLKTIQGPQGAVLLGAYQFLTYRSGEPRGDSQAENLWHLIADGGIEWQLPPALDLEYEAFSSNGTTLTRPISDPLGYLDRTVLPAIEWLSQKMGRRPVVYTGPYFFKQVLSYGLNVARFGPLWECPLWVAAWRNLPEPASCSPLKGASYDLTAVWPKYFLWQYYGDYPKGGFPAWPGINALDLNVFPGSRAELKAFCLNGSLPLPDPDIPLPVTEEWIEIPAVYRNLRKSPDGNSEVIGTLRGGQRFKVVSRSVVGDSVWARVAPSGFVCIRIGSKEYVKVLKVVTGTPSGAPGAAPGAGCNADA